MFNLNINEQESIIYPSNQYQNLYYQILIWIKSNINNFYSHTLILVINHCENQVQFVYFNFVQLYLPIVQLLLVIKNITECIQQSSITFSNLSMWHLLGR